MRSIAFSTVYVSRGLFQDDFFIYYLFHCIQKLSMCRGAVKAIDARVVNVRKCCISIQCQNALKVINVQRCCEQIDGGNGTHLGTQFLADFSILVYLTNWRFRWFDLGIFTPTLCRNRSEIRPAAMSLFEPLSAPRSTTRICSPRIISVYG